MTNLPILDYPKIPVALGPNWQTAFVPASISFDAVWSGPVTRRVNVQNGTNGDQFAGEFEQNQVTVTWSGSNANGFSFTGNPGDLSTTTIPGFAFAEVGHLTDGIFASSDPSGGTSSNGPMLVLGGKQTGGAPVYPANLSSAAQGTTATIFTTSLLSFPPQNMAGGHAGNGPGQQFLPVFTGVSSNPSGSVREAAPLAQNLGGPVEAGDPLVADLNADLFSTGWANDLVFGQ